MKVIAVHRPERMGFNVYVRVREDEHGSWWLTRGGDGAEEALYVLSGSEAPIFLFVTEMVAHALGEALAPRQEASERHLDDAITVRDRLLTMVERLSEAGTHPPVILDRVER